MPTTPSRRHQSIDKTHLRMHTLSEETSLGSFRFYKNRLEFGSLSRTTCKYIARVYDLSMPNENPEKQASHYLESEDLKSKVELLRQLHDMFEDRTNLSNADMKLIAKQFTQSGIEVFKDLAEALAAAKQEEFHKSE